MKIHKLEVYVLDFEDNTKESIIKTIESGKYLTLTVKSCDVADISDWSDDHELNQISATPEQFRKYFKEN